MPKWHLAPHYGMTDDTDLALFEQSAQDNFETFSSLLDIEHLQSDGNMETEYIPVKKSLLRHEDSLKKVDSFSRWASKELGEMEDLQMQSSRGDIAWTTVDCETAAAGLAFSPSLSEDQRFTIVDYWPKCAQTDAEVEVRWLFMKCSKCFYSLVVRIYFSCITLSSGLGYWDVSA